MSKFANQHRLRGGNKRSRFFYIHTSHSIENYHNTLIMD